MAKIRTFIAVDMPDEIRQKAVELSKRLRVSGADVKWVDSQQMHVTLKFLGDVRDVEIPEICQEVQRAVQNIPAFGVRCGGAGAFPRLDRPRTVWLGFNQGEDAFRELQSRVEQAMEPLGFRPERRQFQPHLTLGRVRRPDPALATLSELLEQNAQFEAGEGFVDEVVVYSSDLLPDGPEYTAMSRCELPTG